MSFSKLPTLKWTRQRCTLRICILSFVLLFIFLHLAQGKRASLSQTFQYFLQVAPHVFAAGCNLCYARWGKHRSLVRQRGWLLIGLACVSYSVGDLIYFYYVGMRHVDPPFPGWDDFAWTLVFPLLLGGVFALFGSLPQTGRMRLLLDSAIGNSSVAALGWYFLVGRIWQQSGVSYLGKLVSVLIPLGDIAAIFGAVVLLNSPKTNRNLRRSLLFLASGIIGWTFADLVYAYTRLHGTFHDGSWTDLAWPLGSLAVGLSALIPYCRAENLSRDDSDTSNHSRSSVPRLSSMLLPYAASLGAFLLIAIHDYQDGDHSISNTTLYIGLFMLGLVLFRQVFTLLENRQLARQLVTFNETLEQQVARRTEQLSALLRINTAVNNSLDAEEVLTIAAEHIQEAFQADAVVTWLIEEAEQQDKRAQSDCKMQIYCVSQTLSPTMRTLLERLPLQANTGIIDIPGVQTAEDLVLYPSLENGPRPEVLVSPREGFCLRAPLMWQQQLRGMIGVLRQNFSFEEEEAELLQNIGMAVATALENARLYAKAVEAADRDPVTSLLNHRAMHQRLENALAQAQQQNQPLAVMMLDLNNFKLFNDTYGHLVGDHVLRRVAETMRVHCPASAYLGRYGGDEFIIVFPDQSLEAAIAIAEGMSTQLMAEGFRRSSDDRIIPINLSFGLASYPEDSGNRHELLTIADKNLYTAKLSGNSIGRSNDFQRANRELRTETSYSVLDSMVSAVDNKDRYTRQHSEDVTEYTLWIATELGMSEEILHTLRVGGLLHDVGKIGIPDEILRKPGRLTDEEYDILKQHPSLGALIVGSLPGMEQVVDVVRSHHERWDGEGYPDGLAGENIPLLGRIAAVADAVSAMTTHRPYRRGLSWEVALGEVRKHAGTQFDPELAEAFLRAASKKGFKPATETIQEKAEMQETPLIRKAA